MFKKITLLSMLILFILTSKAENVPWVRFDVALGQGIGIFYTKVNGVKFRVETALEDGGFEPLWSMTWGKLNQWYPMAVDLSKYAGKKIRIRLISEHIENRLCQDYPFWGDPRIGIGDMSSGNEAKVTDQLALRRPDRVGQILPDGTIVDFKEPALFFGYQKIELVTPGLCSPEYNGMVFGGKNYITVLGKNQPGMYIGFDMSHGFGGGPSENQEIVKLYKSKYNGQAAFHENIGVDSNYPYIGKNIPPVFAEWTVSVPPADAEKASGSKVPEKIVSRQIGESFLPLNIKRDVYRFQPGWKAAFNPDNFTWQVNSGTSAGKPGWAFSAVESIGVEKLKLTIKRQGDFVVQNNNSFSGIVVDYHTGLGYQKRVWFAVDKVFSPCRDDRRAGNYIFDAAAFSLKQRLSFKEEFVSITPSNFELDLKKYAPSGWDGRFWIALGMQNIEPGATLEMQLRDNPKVGSNAKITSLAEAVAGEKEFVTLKDKATGYAISLKNGTVCGAWDLKSGERWLDESADIYKIEERYSVSEISETLDKVISVEWRNGGKTLELTCENPSLSNVKLIKSYAFDDDGRFLKKMTVQSRGDAGDGMFFTWLSRSAISPLMRKSLNEGAGFGEISRVAQGIVIEESESAPPAEQGGRERPVTFTKKDNSEGLGAYRWRVNDRFVLLGTNKYTSAGWELFVFCDYIKPGGKSSGEVVFERYAGDFTSLLLKYQSREEFKSLYEMPAPDWMKLLACDFMFTSGDMIRFGKAIEPFYTTSCIWSLGFPWGNYGADHFNPCRNGKNPDVWNIATSYKKTLPLHKMSAYHNFLFDEASDIYKNAQWMGVRDREGSLVASGINSDTTRGASFLYQMGNPGVRQAMTDMIIDQAEQWNFDFYYTDCPGFAVEIPDWGYLDVTQSYDWIEYMRGIYQRLKGLGNDKIIFCNGIVPFSQIGYIEYREAQWIELTGSKWKRIAAELYQQKILEPNNFLRVPTYGKFAAEPGLSAYGILYGWLGNLSDPRRAPWMMAAQELHFGRLQRDSVSPNWLKDSGEVEAYGFTKENIAYLTLLNHAADKQNLKLKIQTKSLGLTPGRNLYIYRWEMQLPDKKNGAFDKTTSLESVKKLTRANVMDLRSIMTMSQTPEVIESDAELSPLATNVVYLTHTPVLIVSVDDFPRQMGLHHSQIRINSKDTDKGLVVTVVNQAKTATLALPGFKGSDIKMITPQSHEISEGKYMQQESAIIKIGSGRYGFLVSKGK